MLQTQDELIQAAKMAVVGQAMTSLAHELNQPLSAMMTYLYTSRAALDAGHYHSLGSDLGKIRETEPAHASHHYCLAQFCP